MLFVFRAVFWLSIVALLLPVHPEGYPSSGGENNNSVERIAANAAPAAQSVLTELVAYCLEEQETCEKGIDMASDQLALNDLIAGTASATVGSLLQTTGSEPASN